MLAEAAVRWGVEACSVHDPRPMDGHRLATSRCWPRVIARRHTGTWPPRGDAISFENEWWILIYSAWGRWRRFVPRLRPQCAWSRKRGTQWLIRLTCVRPVDSLEEVLVSPDRRRSAGGWLPRSGRARLFTRFRLPRAPGRRV